MGGRWLAAFAACSAVSVAVWACGADGGGAGGAGGAGASGGSGGSAGTGAAAGTGGTSSGGIGAGGGSGGDSGVAWDAYDPDALTPCPDGGVPGQTGCECGKLEFTIDTQQSCSMTILPGFQVDGEGFINLSGQDHRVFAMDRWGKGHIVAWCDATTLPKLLQAFNVTGYLGQVDTPKVISFGDDYLCKPGGVPSDPPLPATIQYQGMDLPAKYKGNAALLAQEADVVIFCGFRIPWTYDWAQELSEFVSQHGKGLLAVMEYESLAYQSDYDSMNKTSAQAGIEFQPLNLAWAPSSTSVSIECVPDLPPVM